MKLRKRREPTEKRFRRMKTTLHREASPEYQIGSG